MVLEIDADGRRGISGYRHGFAPPPQVIFNSFHARRVFDQHFARQMWTLTGSKLQRVQGHIMLLIKSAQERVASFLLEMSDRIHASNEVELPMSRQDIADYLGLMIETVSRTLTHLENTAAIALPTPQRIVLRNRAALSRLIA